MDELIVLHLRKSVACGFGEQGVAISRRDLKPRGYIAFGFHSSALLHTPRAEVDPIPSALSRRSRPGDDAAVGLRDEIGQIHDLDHVEASVQLPELELRAAGIGINEIPFAAMMVDV